MDERRLIDELELGRSYESIARALGCHPSTVAAHARRLGVRSAHADHHRPREGVDRALLESLIEEGLSVRAIAARLDVSFSTVRRWLDRHGLRTVRGARRDAGRAARAAGAGWFAGVCELHGPQHFVERDTGFRCVRCRSEAVARRRRRVKDLLIEEAGGACRLCGYDRCAAALHFHHVDPAAKSFSIAGDGVPRALEVLRAEAAKCTLLCANCHAEVEHGVTRLPLPRDPG